MDRNPVARTCQGLVEGEWNEGVARFRGIPFAARIDGAGRFRAPRPAEAWSGVRVTRTWAPCTPQVADPAVVRDAAYHAFLFGAFEDTPMSEEGLFLNLWTPTVDAGAKRPVMVWLHGGGFTTGTPTRPRDEPSLISARGDVVVVAPNHRLGAFGFLHLADPAAGVTPNVGMLDIVAALEWVKRNVEAFGGDPGNVTVFGESGGAMKVATLLAMPRARGLIHRAICQAGVFAKGFRFGPVTPEEADRASRAFLDAVDARWGGADAARVSMRDLIAAQEAVDGTSMAWRPVVDGEILPSDPADAAAQAADVPVIVGWAAHEARFILGPRSRDADELASLMGSIGPRLLPDYARSEPPRDAGDAAEAILTDWLFGMPSIRFAEARAAQGRRTWVYQIRFDRRDDPAVRATHGAENPFVFDRLETTGYTRGAPGGAALSAVMQKAWLAFARAGDPNGPGVPAWPAYAGSSRAVMLFDHASGAVSDPWPREREAWDRELP